MLLCPLLSGANHPGLLSVRQRDTVTGNRCHRPDAVGHITALPVTLREAHPVAGPHPDFVRGVQCDTFSHRLPGRNQPRVTFRILQGYQPVILADTGNPVIHTIHQGKGIRVFLPGGETTQFSVTYIRCVQDRHHDLLFAQLTGLFPCIMNHAVQYAPVLIQVRDNQRLLPCFRCPAGIVADNGLIQCHGDIRESLAFQHRLLLRFCQFRFLAVTELRHGVLRCPCALLTWHLRRFHTLKPGQCPFHIPVNQAVYRLPQFRRLTHNLLHDGHIGSTARLLETERLTGRDGLQLVRVTAGHSTTATGRNQGVCPCHVGIAHH